LFTVLFLLTREPDPSDAAVAGAPTTAEPESSATEPTPADPTPTEQAGTSEPEPTGPATFTKNIDPCAVVDDALVRKLTLFPDKSQILDGECQWETLAPAGGLPNNMQFTLKVYVKVFPDDVGAANEQFVGQRQESVLLAESSSPADPPIGDASWKTVYTLPEGTGQGPTVATVGVRVSNAVIQVTYQRRVGEDPTGRLTQQAQEVAKAVVEKVGTSN
jgi:hypothetical protein